MKHEKKCLANELLYVKTILLVLSIVVFKSPKLMPTSSKTVFYLRFMKYKINTKSLTNMQVIMFYSSPLLLKVSIPFLPEREIQELFY